MFVKMGFCGMRLGAHVARLQSVRMDEVASCAHHANVATDSLQGCHMAPFRYPRTPPTLWRTYWCSTRPSC